MLSRMAIIVFQHSDLCRPGRLGVTLRDHAFKLDILRPDKGDPVPIEFDNIDGVVSLGGPQSAYGKEPWLAKEMDFLRETHDRSLPVVGVCLGHQLLGKALGAEVGPMEKPEAGLCPVDITAAGQTDTILAGVAWRAPHFQIHHDEVKDVPPGATLLATNSHCKVQAFRAGMRTYAFQFHIEADLAMIEALVADSKVEVNKAGLTTDEVRRQCEKHYEMFARLADRIALNIATCLIPRLAAV